MSITIDWMDDEQRIIIASFPDGWTWEDFYAMRDQGKAFMLTKQHTVHIISDFGDNLDVPRGNVMMHTRNVLMSYPENWGLLVIKTRSYMIKALVNTFMKIFSAPFGKKIRMVATIEEARKLIEQFDNSLQT